MEPSVVKIVSFIIAGLLISFSIWQIRRLWLAVKMIPWQKKIPDRTKAFLYRQCRRRIQMNILLGLTGLAFLAGTLVSPKLTPRFWGICWATAILCVSWSLLLALVDALSIRLFYEGSDNRNKAEQIRLRREIIRLCQEARDRRARELEQEKKEQENKKKTESSLSETQKTNTEATPEKTSETNTEMPSKKHSEKKF